MSVLLRSGANTAAQRYFGDTARDIASRMRQHAIVSSIDAHLRRELRSQLVDICSALLAAELPVLVLLECFAWSAATTYAVQHVELPPLDLQWRIAKRLQERARDCAQ